MKLPTLALVVALALALPALAHAEVAWEKTEIDVNASPGDATSVGHFKYQNKGKNLVRVKGVKTSCGCTTAGMKSNDIAPGESGELVATFNIGGKMGVQPKTITVETDEPNHPFTTLTLKTTIAQYVEIQPVYVWWQKGEAAKPKALAMKPGAGVAIQSVEVTSSDRNFAAEAKRGNSGEFLIEVTPRDTARIGSTTLTMKATLANLPPKLFSANAGVTEAAASTSR